jgi:hypothetical protein
MKSKCLLLGAVLCGLLTAVDPVFAEGTAFTSNGRLGMAVFQDRQQPYLLGTVGLGGE